MTRKHIYRNAYNNIADGVAAGSKQLVDDVKLAAVITWAAAWVVLAILPLNLLLIGAATAAGGKGTWARLRYDLI